MLSATGLLPHNGHAYKILHQMEVTAAMEVVVTGGLAPAATITMTVTTGTTGETASSTHKSLA